MRIAEIEQAKLAKTDQEYLDLVASDADWIARSVDDVRQLRAAKEGHLRKSLTQISMRLRPASSLSRVELRMVTTSH